ncbi:MAG: RNA polymerase factor sigma-54, partial [Steroidobacteraceae bacterium]
MTNAVLGLRMRQQLTLTPRLQQSVKLLQLSALECVQELHQAIAQNPFLEEAAEGDDTSSQGEEGETTTGDDLDFSGVGGSAPSDDAPDWTEWTASPSTLRDQLHEQLLLLGLGERDFLLSNLVVDALDDDGFLRQPLAELVPMAVDESAMAAIAPGELETALRIVQTLEPAGIAARDLAECLALQLNALDARTPGRPLALAIVQGKLELVAARDHERLQEALGCTEDELREALDLVRSLDPRPGSKLGSFEPRAIVPDVIVRKEKKRWAVSINSAIYPRIRVNQQYAEQFR